MQLILPAIVTDAPGVPETTPDQAVYGIRSVGVQHAVHLQDAEPFNRPATDAFITIIPAQEGDPAMLMFWLGQWVPFVFTERIKFAQCQQQQAITGREAIEGQTEVVSDAI